MKTLRHQLPIAARRRQRHNRKHGIDKNVDFLLKDLFLAQLIYIFICLTSRLIAGRFFHCCHNYFAALSFGRFFTVIVFVIHFLFVFLVAFVVVSFVNGKTVIKLLFLLICTKNTCAGKSQSKWH